MKTKNKQKQQCSDFEEMLMWTSYRYCIGRHSYVVSMADDIARHYYNKLSNERKQFTANDIRSEIKDCLQFLPFNFSIHRWYSQDEFNPLKVLFNFFEKENINSFEELATIARLEYDSHKDEYTFNRCESNFKSYISQMDIDDLIPWENLASLFDVKNHKMLTLTDGTKVEGFKTWQRKMIPVENKMDAQGPITYYQNAPFGWEETWRSVEDVVKGRKYHYIPKENIKEIEEIKNDGE